MALINSWWKKFFFKPGNWKVLFFGGALIDWQVSGVKSRTLGMMNDATLGSIELMWVNFSDEKLIIFLENLTVKVLWNIE